LPSMTTPFAEGGKGVLQAAFPGIEEAAGDPTYARPQSRLDSDALARSRTDESAHGEISSMPTDV